jgi:hypothetical protein
MFFYMNVRRRMPVLMPNVVKQVQSQPQKQPQPQPQPQRQVVVVPVMRKVEPMVLHESNESREICDNKKEEIIIYNIGDENVEECIPVPDLEEPVIETLLKPVEIIVEEKVEKNVKTKVEDNKKKNKKKNTRK